MNKQMLRIVVLVILGVFLTTQKSNAQVPANCEDVMYQAFYWDSFTDSQWTTLNGQADELSSYFDLIWMPVSGKSSWMGYMPQWWFDQNSYFGSQADLKILIANLKSKGTGCIADVVVNHRDKVNGSFPTESYKGISYPLGNEAIVSNEGGTGAGDTGIDFGGSGCPDLDHKATSVQTAIKAYLDFLKNEMGYTGWRYDMVKGFHGWHVGQYNDASAPYFSVGELWGSYTEIKDWIIATEYKSTGFDFANKYAINDAFANNNLTKLVALGQPAGIIGDPALRRYATTFIDNHDTGRTNPGDDHSDFVGNVAAANAYMLCNPGVPCVWMKHWQANKQAIKEMIDARKAVRLHSQSTVTLISSAWNLYVAETFGLNGSLIVKIGSGSYSAPTGYTLATSGIDYAIWTKKSVPVDPIVSISPASGNYPGGTLVTLSSTGGVAPVKIYYSTNGSTPTSSSTLYSAPFTLTANNTTVKAIAIDNGSVVSDEVSATYTTTTPVNITVKFKAPASWTTIAAYAWTGASNTITNAWPGNTLTKDGDGLVTFTTPFSNSGFNIVFNKGSNAEQTVDILNITSDVCYETTGSTSKYPVVAMSGCFTSLQITTAKANIIIYPNPASESFILESDLNLSLVQIYSISGELVKSVPVSSSQEVIDIQDLSSGFYSVVAVTEEGSRSTTKLIKK